jgi:site-specific DNA recombinase
VISKIKEHILTTENLTKLVELVNEEMDAASSSYRDELETIAKQLGGVDQRLGNLYNAIETGNIQFDLLKPRLEELKVQHDKLIARKAELEMLISHRRIELSGPELVTKYVEDLRQFIDSTEISERRAFIKSFVKEIRVSEHEIRMTYNFPIPPDGHQEEKLGVLSIERYGGR